MAIKMPMMRTTTMSSMSVKPASWSPRRGARDVDILDTTFRGMTDVPS